MAWIESHQTLREHPKLTVLSESLGVTKAQAIGHLHMLWWWCIDYADDGQLDQYTPLQIARAMDWEGAPEELIKHLTDSVFLDPEPLRVHDWLDFCGDLIKKRLEYRKDKHRRTKRLRESLRKSENSQPTVTVTSRTVPTAPEKESALTFDFAKIYDQYPNKDSRKDAEKHFKASVKSAQDFADIQKALANYVKHLLAEPWKQPKSAKTWFNDWKPWVTYAGVTLKVPSVSKPFKENIPHASEIYDPAEKAVSQ